METKTEKKEWISKGKFDSTNSTFFHKIKLQNAEPPLKGYNKPLIGGERFDKIVELEKFIFRIVVNNGYLFSSNKKHNLPTLYIEYYFNGKYYGTPDEWIFTLYPDKFIFGNNKEINESKRFYQFLQRLYEGNNNAVFDPAKIIHKPIAISEADLFDYTRKKPNIQNDRQLLDFYHVHRQAGKVEESMLYNFVVQYRNYHFNK
jgi:hypothetical protein